MTLRGRDYLSVDDLTPDELYMLLGFAQELKTRALAGDRPPLLAGKTLALIFEKPSLRTRVSFEVGMFQLGGMALYLGPLAAVVQRALSGGTEGVVHMNAERCGDKR